MGLQRLRVLMSVVIIVIQATTGEITLVPPFGEVDFLKILFNKLKLVFFRKKKVLCIGSNHTN